MVMFRSRYETFIIQDDGRELFRTWSLTAVYRYLKVINCDHIAERVCEAVDKAYEDNRHPLDRLELVIDIREDCIEERTD